MDAELAFRLFLPLIAIALTALIRRFGYAQDSIPAIWLSFAVAGALGLGDALLSGAIALSVPAFDLADPIALFEALGAFLAVVATEAGEVFVLVKLYYVALKTARVPL